MNKLIVKAVMANIVKWFGRGIVFVLVIAVLFGLYMCEHYRWGGCK